MSESAEILKQQFSQSLGLPWTDILPASRLDELLKEEAFPYRNRVYSPIVTLWAMLYQVLSADKSLRNTVNASPLGSQRLASNRPHLIPEPTAKPEAAFQSYCCNA